MNDKLIEILMHLLGHLKDHDLDVDSLSEFSDRLLTRGYDEKEIAEAIHWFLERFNSHTVMSTEIIEQKSDSVRILHDYERMNIPPEIYGYLLKLKNMSVITGAQMEKIMDHYMLLGPNSLSKYDVEDIIASVLFDNH